MKGSMGHFGQVKAPIISQVDGTQGAGKLLKYLGYAALGGLGLMGLGYLYLRLTTDFRPDYSPGTVDDEMEYYKERINFLAEKLDSETISEKEVDELQGLLKWPPKTGTDYRKLHAAYRAKRSPVELRNKIDKYFKGQGT